MDELFSSIKSLKGVGEKRAKCYEKMGINTVYDLICHFPKNYIDFTAPVEILEAVVGETSVIKATVTHKLPEQHIRRGLSVYKATATDGNADFTLVFYNNHYAFDALKVDAEYFFYGRVSGGFLRREMNSPQVLSAGISDLLQPIYALTDGLTGAMVITNVKQALENFDENGYETLPQVFLEKYDIPTLAFAFQNIHFPKDNFALEMAKKRLAFEELFTLQLGMLLLKGRNTALCGCQMKNFDLAEFYDSLPFLLTTAQKNAVLEIISDMQQQIPMNRLLQGDV
ncbi:MAG: ATP-dependent DNA helicase RecG, partial [Oscillospiraceae bacterium]